MAYCGPDARGLMACVLGWGGGGGSVRAHESHIHLLAVMRVEDSSRVCDSGMIGDTVLIHHELVAAHHKVVCVPRVHFFRGIDPAHGHHT